MTKRRKSPVLVETTEAHLCSRDLRLLILGTLPFFQGLSPSDANSIFQTCAVIATNANPYGIRNEESVDYPYILLCRHPRRLWEEFWKDFHYFG
jgi:hypothetical protein